VRSHPGETQPERTRLAVHRTAAANLVVAMALLRTAVALRSAVAALAAALGAGLSLASLIAARHEDRTLSSMPPFPAAAATLALAVALTALAGLTVAIRRA